MGHSRIMQILHLGSKVGKRNTSLHECFHHPVGQRVDCPFFIACLMHVCPPAAMITLIIGALVMHHSKIIISATLGNKSGSPNCDVKYNA